MPGNWSTYEQRQAEQEAARRAAEEQARQQARQAQRTGRKKAARPAAEHGPESPYAKWSVQRVEDAIRPARVVITRHRNAQRRRDVGGRHADTNISGVHDCEGDSQIEDHLLHL